MSEERFVPMDAIAKILEEDWLYDLLPGDGKDDYILQRLREEFQKASVRCVEVRP